VRVVFDALWNWFLFVLGIPIFLPMFLVFGLVFGFRPHTKFYDHIFGFGGGKEIYCGYCGIKLVKTGRFMSAYEGTHKWWCFLIRANRNELIVSGQ
jgi:hypothetical protein